MFMALPSEALGVLVNHEALAKDQATGFRAQVAWWIVFSIIPGLCFVRAFEANSGALGFSLQLPDATKFASLPSSLSQGHPYKVFLLTPEAHGGAGLIRPQALYNE
ncbi:hypothetical protein VFPPC_01081 [Pochonia chlamydosporia 170]|uniref:Uncharacterized protein n=1 Tax=Pochonia chlamydosporia 170 TaxID=1380566 RepID=A0A179G6A2_METCM|nr:hypothetical protein VFPPC_01081 [Pochonia chlamydosporia 170]OAQ73352.2 hypothetical protein VFPPC_01081 [Pochonia chlamydosporia 170]